MVKPLRLVHTSDVHVDDAALERRAADFPLRRVVDLVAAEAADLLLIAGDLFDSSRVSAAAVERVLDELRRVPATTVVLPGNHDCYDGDSIYHRVDFRDAGSHVHALLDEDGETLEFPELHATVWAVPWSITTPPTGPSRAFPCDAETTGTSASRTAWSPPRTRTGALRRSRLTRSGARGSTTSRLDTSTCLGT